MRLAPPRALIAAGLLLLPAPRGSSLAPGAPGARATWTGGSKQGIGTAATAESKVWFTLGDGAVTEIYYPSVDKAETRLLELLVADGRGFLERETRDTDHQVRPADPRALAFEQVNTSRSGRYRLSKTVISDPARPVVLVHLRFEPLDERPLRLFACFDPAVNNSGLHDDGEAGGGTLTAEEGDLAVALVSSPGFSWTSTGYLDTSDGLAALAAGAPLPTYRRSPDGNVAQMAEIPLIRGAVEATLAVGFGRSAAEAAAAARESLARPFAATYRAYVAGWNAYVAGLTPVGPKYARAFASAAMVLKAHEDKTRRGAMIASLTVPWGDEVDAGEGGVGGYHLVWSRDLYHAATAFAAMGDRDAAARALGYLFEVQQRADGSFPQNSWLDGRPFWPSLQLDEVAYPLILAQQLGRTDGDTYRRHVRPAADFIVGHGPTTPQERWEELSGYSPSTIAAEIAGLVAAAQIAEGNGDAGAAARYRATADDWAARLDGWTVTRTGPLSPDPYFVRIAGDGQPDGGRLLTDNNSGRQYDERAIVDAGFLELVRLGIRRPDDARVLSSLAVVDRVLRAETPAGPAFYRYNHDGYGETPDGRGYRKPDGVGRLWPLLTGERGEYALAAGQDATPYLDALLASANEGGMLPEQVWDRPESPSPRLRFGRGTGSATPLAWSCAQLVRLVRGVEEKRVVEMPEVVREHFRERVPRRD